jgi:hypothetical protein
MADPKVPPVEAPAGFKSEADFNAAIAAEQRKTAEANRKVQTAERATTALQADFDEFKEGQPTDDDRATFRTEQRDLRTKQRNLADQERTAGETMLEAKRIQIRAKHPNVTEAALEGLALTDLKGFEAGLDAATPAATPPTTPEIPTATPTPVPTTTRIDTQGGGGGGTPTPQSRQELKDQGMREMVERSAAQRAAVMGAGTAAPTP